MQANLLAIKNVQERQTNSWSDSGKRSKMIGTYVFTDSGMPSLFCIKFGLGMTATHYQGISFKPFFSLPICNTSLEVKDCMWLVKSYRCDILYCAYAYNYIKYCKLLYILYKYMSVCVNLNLHYSDVRDRASDNGRICWKKARINRNYVLKRDANKQKNRFGL